MVIMSKPRSNKDSCNNVLPVTEEEVGYKAPFVVQNANTKEQTLS